MALKRPAGDKGTVGGLLIVAESPSPKLGMQCHRFDPRDFDAPDIKEQQRVRHGGELVEREETAFFVDVAQMGVGGIDSWGNKPLPQHMIPPTESFTWACRLQPLTAEQAAADSSALVALARGA